MVTIEEIRQAIADREPGSWEAGDTSAWRRGASAGDPSSLLFGLKVGPPSRNLRAAAGSLFEELIAPPPPQLVDWRKDQGGRVTPVKDQGRCGACVAFATCAAMESVELIRNGVVVSLSEGHLFHCGGGSCDDGWEFLQGLKAAMTGIGRETDLPWDPDGSCVSITPSLRVQSYKAHERMRSRKRAVAAGPVLAGMAVYEDFLAYRSGVYRHVAGEFLGNHAVCVVGYNDADSCWIVKNSWGTDFGENGFFKIAYGQRGIDSDFAFFSIEVDVCS